MSNQIVITSGAKVRNLSGVLTATSGVVDSVGLGTANGVATLDSNGKVPLSQLPASVVTYLGTWNAATNTPTLANGTGDIGDLYICNVAGTVNFGAGPITFAVGDWVIYNGAQWQKSAGSSGTVTSVAMTVPTGLSVTGSPITTSGTLAVTLSSGYTIPTTSFLSGLVPYTGASSDVTLGAKNISADNILLTSNLAALTRDLIDNVGILLLKNNANGYIKPNYLSSDRTYLLPDASGTLALTSDIPSLSGYVPYTGATQTVDLGSYDLNARGIKINGTGGLGHADFKHQSGTPTGSASSSTLYANTDGNIAWLNDHSYTITLAANANTANRTYTFPNASGTLALTSDIPSISATAPIYYIGGVISITQSTAATNGYLSSTDWNTFNNKQAALSGSGFVKIAGTTISYDNNTYLPTTGGNLTGVVTTSAEILSISSFALSETGTLTNYANYTNFTGTPNGLKFKLGGGMTGSLLFDIFGIKFKNNFGYTAYLAHVASADLTYNLPASAGTLALTSDIPSLSGYVQGSGTTNYIPKFTASGTIGNSLVYDNGTVVAIGSNSFSGGAKLITYQTSSNTAESGIISYTTAGAMAFLADTTTGDLFRGDSTIASVKSTKFRVTNTGQGYFASNVGIGTTSPSFLLDVNGSARVSGNLTAQATGTGYGLTVNGLANYYSAYIQGSTTTGQSAGLLIQAGTNSSDSALIVTNATAGTQFFKISGTGAATFSSSVTASGQVEGTIINSTFNAFRLNGNNALSLVTLNSQSVVKINAAGFWGTQLVGANDNGIVINNVGNVGIGTTSPADGLTIETNSNNYNALALRDSRAYNTSPEAALAFRLKYNSAGAYATPALFVAYKDNTTDGNQAGGIAFYTNPNSSVTERMRITSGGNVLVGSTSGVGSGKIFAYQSAASSNGIDSQVVTNNYSTYVGYNSSSQATFYVTGNGQIWAISTSISGISDISTKENIRPIPYGLNSILKLNPVIFDYKKDNIGDGVKDNYGFIAQEVEKILPELVKESNESLKTLKMGDILPVLVKAIQEQQAQIEELKALINK